MNSWAKRHTETVAKLYQEANYAMAEALKYIYQMRNEWRAILDLLGPQCATMKFSAKSKASNKTYPGLISMLQGFQICIT